MEKIALFVSEHMNDDVTRLILNRKTWPEIDIDMAVACIESRRKLKGKLNEWYDEPGLVFPFKISAEQCSSSATGRYKADIADRITGGGHAWKLADLTGGLGADSWFFSKKAGHVLYNEMNPGLCKAAEHNFKTLGAGNISISNHTVDMTMTTPSVLLSDFKPDIVYMDPARRGEGGKKVFLIEECSPDVLTLKEDIFRISRHILLKLSPMADISMVCSRLGSTCREVHVVATGGECKELLIWMDREWQGSHDIHAVELEADGRIKGSINFRPSDERESHPQIWDGNKGRYLFEPGKAIMKAGAFNIIGCTDGLRKLGRSTHYYISDTGIQKDLQRLGKVFRIIGFSHLDKKSIKAAGRDYPKAEVTARNIPLDSEELRKKTGVTSGGDAHIFGLKSDRAGNLLFITKRISSDELDEEGQERPLQD